MSLKYHPKEKKIVFDFLVPASSKLEGIYEYYGPSLNQIDMLGGVCLHNAGFRGQGMQIAVIDAGFYNIDIDASTLVDLDKSSLDNQQKNNLLV